MSEFTTPMMKQYEEIKKQYSDCLLFYRLGDFYELFMEDATVGAKVLNLTLTGRPRGKDGRIPMAGVPFHAVDSYLAKLVKAGYKVAICEQVSEPDKKGIVDREVVRIVTPGTVLDEKTLNSKENNYIISLTYDSKILGIACADLSTGQFQAANLPFENLEHILINEVAKISPSECILPARLYNDSRILKALKTQQNLNIFCYQNWDNFSGNPQLILKNHFKIKSLESFSLHGKVQAQTASAALLGYLKETQKDKVDHFKTITCLSSDRHVLLDRSTITNLELFSTIRDSDKRGSLLSIIDHTITPMGGRMLRDWVRKPLSTQDDILQRHDAVEVFFSNADLLTRVGEELHKVTDFERALSRLAVGIGNARDMISLKDSLQTALRLKDLLKSYDTCVLLNNIKGGLADNTIPIIELIDRTILDDPKFDPKEGGIIKDGVDPQCDELRLILNNGNAWIGKLEKQERERSGISSLKVRFNKVFGFYIEVSNANLNMIPQNYNRKQTLVNGERFITPELKKQEELILTAQEKLNKLEYELYLKVCEEIISNLSSLQNAAASIAKLDCLTGFADLAVKEHYVRASIINNGEISIKNGRHPVVEQVLTERQFVPNSVSLSSNNQQLWIITGPNMAGKSVFIRQVALIVLLNQIGSYIPAQSASLSVVDKIFVRSGASDVISEGLSTFMVEMVETAQILNQATSKSLIVMDEIGRGTSTYDGISIAWAVAEYLVTQKNCQAKTLFATHYHELQELEERYPARIKNYSMSVEETDGELNFLHTIRPEKASHSFGVAVAKLAGIPSTVTTNAYTKLHDLESRHNSINGQPASQLPLAFNSTDSIIEKELQSLDIHQMTPLQALNKLAELKNKLKLIQATGDSFFKAG